MSPKKTHNGENNNLESNESDNAAKTKIEKVNNKLYLDSLINQVSSMYFKIID